MILLRLLECGGARMIRVSWFLGEIKQTFGGHVVKQCKTLCRVKDPLAEAERSVVLA